MAYIQCKKCNSDSLTRLGWDHFSVPERQTYNMHIGMGGNTPHTLAMKAAYAGVMTAARWACSEVYMCNKCKETQRVWFK
jgi:hypothetical protein